MNLALQVSVHDVHAARQNGEPLMLLDCRERDEREIAHIDDTLWIPMEEIPARLPEIAAARDPLIVYCHHGVRSLHVVKWLRQQGLAQAQSMAGGIDQWSLEIDPDVPRY